MIQALWGGVGFAVALFTIVAQPSGEYAQQANADFGMVFDQLQEGGAADVQLGLSPRPGVVLSTSVT